jgi:hypothetical protein
MNREVNRIVNGKHTIDGGGVELIRVIGKPDVDDFDPFLMLDAFDHDNDVMPSLISSIIPWPYPVLCHDRLNNKGISFLLAVNGGRCL